MRAKLVEHQFPSEYVICERRNLRIDDLTNNLRQNLKEGFENGKYDLVQAIKIMVDVFYIGDNVLNDILLNIITDNFTILSDKLYYVDINILRSIISKDELNINSEQYLVLFLSNYYIKNQNYILDIDIKLISYIRILTLSTSEIQEIKNSRIK